ncbi:N-acetylmuramoyl-L-alanine amidase [Clostridium sp. SHJSY1]|uniref:N-acetylmuramoyl-L-alanine amidase n=1 Tax=Clostridium sp. SHJSY1 TaxID=2942483 RepID=UPI002874E26A|nr:N-acetylmuramoyl-L-alanine amidase [Clostridium sp. SHJSY1]MDS0524463.1 N-acetylmuramoyl-L-alanine amidase [Clostridium sp. SHJSY1]
MNKKVLKFVTIMICTIVFISFKYLVDKNDLKMKRADAISANMIDLSNNLVIPPLNDDIKIIRPLKKKIYTREETITFLGMADPNKDLKLNNKKIDVYYTGNFVLEVPLSVGINNLNFSLGDKKLSYIVIREFSVIDSIRPSKLVNIEGGMDITITARLYSGSKAYAELNGEHIELKEVESNKYLSARGTSYVNFIGNITTNEVKEESNLGHIVIHSVYNGVKETKSGARVILNKPQIKESVGVINKDSSFVYDNKTISVIPLNEVYPLAKGTEDYITSKIIVDEKEYYNLASGKRVKTEDIDIVPYKVFEKSKITNISVFEEDNNVLVKIDKNNKYPYTFLTDDIGFKDMKNQDYSLDDYKLQNIKIYFDYDDNTKAKIKFKRNFLFKDASLHEENGKNYLYLNLKDSNKYNGHFAYYDEDGSLIFKFKDKKKSLKNMKIVIDPGHGLIENNKLDPGALGFNCINENFLNLEISRLVEYKLKERGAHVVRLETENTSYPLKIRGSKGYENDADLYISIHHNSGGSGKLNANESYYFTPYSKDYAKSINESLTSCYNKVLYKGSKGDYSRGFKYNYYTVTLERENPSVLIEVGYIDNPVFFDKIINEECQIKIASSIVDGIEKSIK